MFCVPFFRISHQEQHSRGNSKDFVVYFFAALIKHKIRMKCECVVSDSCFVKTFAKYPQNAKYEKCTASLTEIEMKNFQLILTTECVTSLPSSLFLRAVMYLS